MVIRVLTDSNYLDIELKEEIKEEVLAEAIGNMDILLFEKKDGNKIFINPINIVSLEIIKSPPIS